MVKHGRAKRKKDRKPAKPPSPSNPPPKEEETFPINTLPAEHVLQLLYRFAVKILLRFRGLSKSWAALIDHPSFIQKHLKFNSSRNKQLICNSSYDDGKRNLIAFLSANDPPIPLLDINIYFPDRPNYPVKINFFDFSKNMVLAGSVSGIVCLYHRKEMLGQFVALWNPAIRRWKPIALPKTKSWLTMSVGLGFDVVANDFKIICIVRLIDSGKSGWSRVEIYSANQDSWDGVDESMIIPFFPVLNVLHCKFIVKGVPYWVGIDAHVTDLMVLGRIDPCTGLFRKFLFPEHIKNESTVAHVVNLRDSVTALVLSPGEHPNQMVDLYELDENTANWTRMYSIGPLEFDTMRVPQCLSTGEIVLETWTRKVDHASNKVNHFCDPETSRVFRNNGIEKLNPYWAESYSHVESMVCLKGMVQIGKEHIYKKTDPEMNWSEYLSKELEEALHL